MAGLHTDHVRCGTPCLLRVTCEHPIHIATQRTSVLWENTSQLDPFACQPNCVAHHTALRACSSGLCEFSGLCGFFAADPRRWSHRVPQAEACVAAPLEILLVFLGGPPTALAVGEES